MPVSTRNAAPALGLAAVSSPSSEEHGNPRATWPILGQCGQPQGNVANPRHLLISKACDRHVSRLR